jgi:hypothetical protein
MTEERPGFLRRVIEYRFDEYCQVLRENFQQYTQLLDEADRYPTMRAIVQRDGLREETLLALLPIQFPENVTVEKPIFLLPSGIVVEAEIDPSGRPILVGEIEVRGTRLVAVAPFVAETLDNLIGYQPPAEPEPPPITW